MLVNFVFIDFVLILSFLIAFFCLQNLFQIPYKTLIKLFPNDVFTTLN